MAALVAAVTVRQLDHARDGAGAPSSLRPLADAIDAVDLPLLKAFTPSCRAGPSGRKTPIPKARSPTRPGCAPASAAGQATTANQPPIIMFNEWLALQATKDGANLTKRDV